MQLEQSGFRIYQGILSRVPSCCLLALAAACLALLALNSLLVSDSHLETSFEACWQRYYDQLHPDNREFVKQMVIRNKGEVSEHELVNQYLLLNWSTIVRIETSPTLSAGDNCLIDLNPPLQEDNQAVLQVNDP